MIGGGIFAILGLAIAVAGHAAPLTLACGGVIAVITGLSYAQLGLAYRGDGGSFTYIAKAFSSRIVARLAGWLLIAGYVGTLALYATAFGDYGAAMLAPGQHFTWLPGVLSAAALGGFLVVNLAGAKLSGRVELGVVAVKLAILALFVAVAGFGMDKAHFEPVFDRGLVTPFAAVALIFVAYEGFELIPNAIDEMQDPDRNLRRAILLAVLITTVIYVLVAIVAVGNLTPVQIRTDQEYVLAVAARPTLGRAGFALIGFAALLSTSSAINATLFGAARLSMVMSQQGALPRIFSRQRRDRTIPYVSLLALTASALVVVLAADLKSIAVLASATFLLIFALVNFSALRLSRRIGLNPATPLAGSLLAGGAFCGLIWSTWSSDPRSLLWLGAIYGGAAVATLFARRGSPTGLTPP